MCPLIFKLGATRFLFKICTSLQTFPIFWLYVHLAHFDVYWDDATGKGSVGKFPKEVLALVVEGHKIDRGNAVKVRFAFDMEGDKFPLSLSERPELIILDRMQGS